MPSRYIEKRMRENLERMKYRTPKTVKLAYAMYWSCYEEGDSARLFNPYYVANPLVEYFNPIPLLNELYQVRCHNALVEHDSV